MTWCLLSHLTVIQTWALTSDRSILSRSGIHSEPGGVILKKTIAVALLATALSSGGWIRPARAPAQTSRDRTLVVGVFRPDGVIVPFALYAQRRWTNPWHSPVPDAPPDEPDTIADLPKPWYESFVKPAAEWYLSLSS